VRCNLIHTTLSQCGDEIIDHYTALSYVWGTATDVRPIWVDESPVCVTANLHSALRHLQDKTRILRLWADAICIDQNNDEEKGKQVALMGRIYFLAHHTVIYLGSPEPRAEYLLGSLIPTNGSLSRPLPQTSSTLQVADLILSKTWFRRVWVFQELIFSRDPWIQYGIYRWRWSHLYSFLEEQIKASSPGEKSSSKGATESVDSLPAPISDKRTLQGYQILSEMQLARDWHFGKPDKDNKITMLEILLTRRGLGATDPRDMIYAHTGFVSDGQHETVVADYAKTCKQLYDDFARYKMESSMSYSILSHVVDHTLSTRPDGLASWAPDWSSSKSTTPLPCFSTRPDPSDDEPHQSDDEIRQEVFRSSYIRIQDSSILVCALYELRSLASVSRC
jgi:hypothetical protein